MNVMTAITMPPGPARFTAAEFWRFATNGAFDDIKLELIEGELHRMPPPGNAHSRLQIALVTALLRVTTEPLIRAEMGIDLGNDTIVGCDGALLKVVAANDGWASADEIALVVEIAVSTRDRDLGLKRRLYAAAGIPTYWVVDAQRAVVHVFERPESDDYLRLTLVGFGEPLPVPGSNATIVLE